MSQFFETILSQFFNFFVIQAFIDGKWVEARNKVTFEVSDPATGDCLGNVPDMSASDTLKAIDAAKKAQSR